MESYYKRVRVAIYKCLGAKRIPAEEWLYSSNRDWEKCVVLVIQVAWHYPLKCWTLLLKFLTKIVPFPLVFLVVAILEKSAYVKYTKTYKDWFCLCVKRDLVLDLNVLVGHWKAGRSCDMYCRVCAPCLLQRECLWWPPPPWISVKTKPRSQLSATPSRTQYLCSWETELDSIHICQGV